MNGKKVTLHTYESCLVGEGCPGVGPEQQGADGSWFRNVCLEHTVWDEKKNRWARVEDGE